MIHINVPEHGEAIAKRAGCGFNEGRDVVISRTDSSQETLRGGFIFTGYTGRSIFAHFAGFDPHWLNRAMIWYGFTYVFKQLDCEQLLTWNKETNHTALEINAKLGFNKPTRIPGVYYDGDAVVMTMRREECRWLSLTPRILA